MKRRPKPARRWNRIITYRTSWSYHGWLKVSDIKWLRESIHEAHNNTAHEIYTADERWEKNLSHEKNLPEEKYLSNERLWVFRVTVNHLPEQRDALTWIQSCNLKEMNSFRNLSLWTTCWRSKILWITLINLLVNINDWRFSEYYWSSIKGGFSWFWWWKILEIFN